MVKLKASLSMRKSLDTHTVSPCPNFYISWAQSNGFFHICKTRLYPMKDHLETSSWPWIAVWLINVNLLSISNPSAFMRLWNLTSYTGRSTKKPNSAAKDECWARQKSCSSVGNYRQIGIQTLIHHNLSPTLSLEKCLEVCYPHFIPRKGKYRTPLDKHGIHSH